MKKNSAEILLSSFSPSSIPQDKGLRKYQFYYDLFSGLTEGGIRSSIALLVEKRYLSRYVLNGQSLFRITDAGIGKLSLLYPSLRTKERKKAITGHLIIFLKPIAHDSQFIKIKRVIAKENFTQVTRGVYFSNTGIISDQLMQFLVDSYSSAVTVASVSEFSLAIPDSTFPVFQQKKELEQTLSGLSRELSLLINKNVLDNKLKYQSKIAIENFFRFLKNLSHSSFAAFLEERKNRTDLFQAIEDWNSLIEIHYFSQKS